MKSHTLVFALFSLQAAPVLAFQVPSGPDLQGQLAMVDLQKVMSDVAFFHELRIRQAPNGYESNADFRNNVAAVDRNIWTAGNNLQARVQQWDADRFSAYVDASTHAFASTEAAYRSFLTSQGIDDSGPLADEFLGSLLVYGVLVASANGDDFDVARKKTYIWPWCMPQNPDGTQN